MCSRLASSSLRPALLKRSTTGGKRFTGVSDVGTTSLPERSSKTRLSPCLVVFLLRPMSAGSLTPWASPATIVLYEVTMWLASSRPCTPPLLKLLLKNARVLKSWRASLRPRGWIEWSNASCFRGRPSLRLAIG